MNYIINAFWNLYENKNDISSETEFYKPDSCVCVKDLLNADFSPRR